MAFPGKSQGASPGLGLLAGAALVLTAGALAVAGTGVPAAKAASSLPCDIYASGGTPCVAA